MQSLGLKRPQPLSTGALKLELSYHIHTSETNQRVKDNLRGIAQGGSGKNGCLGDSWEKTYGAFPVASQRLRLFHRGRGEWASLPPSASQNVGNITRDTLCTLAAAL